MTHRLRRTAFEPQPNVRVTLVVCNFNNGRRVDEPGEDSYFFVWHSKQLKPAFVFGS